MHKEFLLGNLKRSSEKASRNWECSIKIRYRNRVGIRELNMSAA